MAKTAKIFVLCFVMVFALGGVASAEQKVLNWTYPTAVPATHQVGQIFTKHFKNISQRTNGQLNIQFTSWGETPYKGNEALRIMKNKLESTCEILHAYVVGDEPLLAASDMIFLLPKHYTDMNEFFGMYKKLYANPKVNALREKIAGDYGYVTLGVYFWGPQNFFMRKPVNKPADFKGLQIRYPLVEGADLLKALGATSVVVTAPEVYTSLQRGLFDGVVGAPQSITAMKWGEVLTHVYLLNQGTGGSSFAVNKPAWDSLPDEVKKILKEEVEAAAAEINAWTIDDTPKVYEILKQKYNFTVTVATEEDYQYMRNICQEQVWPGWVKRVGPKGKDVFNTCLEAVGAPKLVEK